jgi:hypothetical protein
VHHWFKGRSTRGKETVIRDDDDDDDDDDDGDDDDELSPKMPVALYDSRSSMRLSISR